MAETRTSRLSLPNWSAGTDTGSRSDFNEAFTNLDLWGARDEQGLRSARPAAGIRGRYYTSTDTKVLYRDNGAGWDVVGGVVENSVALPSATGNVAEVVRGLAGQTADLFQVQDSTQAVMSRFRADGSLYVNAASNGPSHFGPAASVTAATLAVVPSTAARTALILRGFASQAADLFKVQDSGGSDLLKVDAAGNITAPRHYASTTPAVGSNELVTKGYVDAAFIGTAGGTLTADLNFNMAAAQIKNVQTGGTFAFVMSRAGASDTMALRIAADGGVQVGGLTGAQAGTVPLTVKGAASQSANIMEWKNSADAVQATMNAAGVLGVNTLNVSGTSSARLIRGTSAAIGDLVAIIKGFAGQTGDLLRFTDSSDVVMSSVAADGSLFVNGLQAYTSGRDATNTMQALITARLAAHRGLVVRGAGSQSAALQEWQDSGNAVLSSITNAGSFSTNGGNSILFGASAAVANLANLYLAASGTTHRPLVLRGAASQAAALQEWQASGGAVLSSVGSSGHLRGPAGSVGAPSHSFQSSTDTGMYSSTAGQIDFAAGGSLMASILANGTLDARNNLRGRKVFVQDTPAVAGITRRYSNVAGYESDSMSGAIVFETSITLSTTVQNLNIRIAGSRYASLVHQYTEAVVSGQFYLDGGGNLVTLSPSVGVAYLAGYRVPIRFARRTSNNKLVVIIGDVTDTGILYCNYIVENVALKTGTPNETSMDGWTSTATADLSAYSNVTVFTDRSVIGSFRIESVTGVDQFTVAASGMSFYGGSLTATTDAGAGASNANVVANTGTVPASAFRAVRINTSAVNAHVAEFGIRTAGVDAITAWITKEGDFQGKGVTAGLKAGSIGAFLLNPAADATSGVTTQDSGSLAFRTSRWTGAAAAVEDATLQAFRRSSTVGDVYLQSTKDFTVRNTSSTLQSILAVGDVNDTIQPTFVLNRKATSGANLYSSQMYLRNLTTLSALRIGLLKNGSTVGNIDINDDGTVNTSDDMQVAGKSLPRGILGSVANITADSNSVSSNVITDVVGLTVTVTVAANRRLRLMFTGSQKSTVAGDQASIVLREGTTNLRAAQTPDLPAPGVSVNNDTSVIVEPTAGTHTYKVSMQRISGTGTVVVTGSATIPSQFYVEDLGSTL